MVKKSVIRSLQSITFTNWDNFDYPLPLIQLQTHSENLKNNFLSQGLTQEDSEQIIDTLEIFYLKNKQAAEAAFRIDLQNELNFLDNDETDSITVEDLLLQLQDTAKNVKSSLIIKYSKYFTLEPSNEATFAELFPIIREPVITKLKNSKTSAALKLKSKISVILRNTQNNLNKNLKSITTFTKEEESAYNKLNNDLLLKNSEKIPEFLFFNESNSINKTISKEFQVQREIRAGLTNENFKEECKSYIYGISSEKSVFDGLTASGPIVFFAQMIAETVPKDFDKDNEILIESLSQLNVLNIPEFIENYYKKEEKLEDSVTGFIQACDPSVRPLFYVGLLVIFSKTYKAITNIDATNQLYVSNYREWLRKIVYHISQIGKLDSEWALVQIGEEIVNLRVSD